MYFYSGTIESATYWIMSWLPQIATHSFPLLETQIRWVHQPHLQIQTSLHSHRTDGDLDLGRSLKAQAEKEMHLQTRALLHKQLQFSGLPYHLADSQSCKEQREDPFHFFFFPSTQCCVLVIKTELLEPEHLQGCGEKLLGSGSNTCTDTHTHKENKVKCIIVSTASHSHTHSHTHSSHSVLKGVGDIRG